MKRNFFIISYLKKLVLINVILLSTFSIYSQDKDSEMQYNGISEDFRHITYFDDFNNLQNWDINQNPYINVKNQNSEMILRNNSNKPQYLQNLIYVNDRENFDLEVRFKMDNNEDSKVNFIWASEQLKITKEYYYAEFRGQNVRFRRFIKQTGQRQSLTDWIPIKYDEDGYIILTIRHFKGFYDVYYYFLNKEWVGVSNYSLFEGDQMGFLLKDSPIKLDYIKVTELSNTAESSTEKSNGLLNIKKQIDDILAENVKNYKKDLMTRNIEVYAQGIYWDRYYPGENIQYSYDRDHKSVEWKDVINIQVSKFLGKEDGIIFNLADGRDESLRFWENKKGYNKNFYYKLISIFENLVENQKEQLQGEPSNLNNPSVTDELLKLKSLLDSGAITQDEYDKLKAKLLDGM